MPKSPKVWLITSAASPLGYSIALKALQNGDFVALCCRRDEVAADFDFARGPNDISYNDDDVDVDMDMDTPTTTGVSTAAAAAAATAATDKRLTQSISLSRLHTAFPSHSIIIELDTRSIALCQSSLSQCVGAFSGSGSGSGSGSSFGSSFGLGRVDVLLVCSTKTYVGCIEEIPMQSVLAQFEAATFGSINIVRAALPILRRQRAGHILVVTGVTGGMGTPALGVRCAADHAVEGFCDALAYEIAPFGVRVTVVQPPIEVNVLSNPLTIFPPHPEYAKSNNSPASFMRNLISGMYPSPAVTTTTTTNTSSTTNGDIGSSNSNSSSTSPQPQPQPQPQPRPQPQPPTTAYNSSTLPTHHSPPASLHSLQPILAETVHVITSIAGLDDPPGRIVVGSENAEQVKERLKAVSEELEDFLEVSIRVDAKPASVKDPGGGGGGGGGGENRLKV